MEPIEVEQKIITKFVIKAKQDRYLSFLSGKKNRHKFIDELYHFSDFNWGMFREITGSENERQAVAAEVKKRNITSCHIISASTEYDGKSLPAAKAIEEVIGIEATIIIFGNADLIYYEGEAPRRRYIGKS